MLSLAYEKVSSKLWPPDRSIGERRKGTLGQRLSLHKVNKQGEEVLGLFASVTQMQVALPACTSPS